VHVVLASPVLRDPAEFARVLLALLEVAIMVNVAQFRATPTFPTLARSGVKYTREAAFEFVQGAGELVAKRRPYDSVRDAWAVLKDGAGDCAHLVAWDVADKHLGRGVPVDTKAKPRIEWRTRTVVKSGRRKSLRVFHVQTRCGDGRIEDPSARLGM